MDDNEYFSHLYEIARELNREFSLHAALKKSLEKTVDLLELETGWVWLVQGDVKSVYLAASYNLPPALSKHPERLSGWCYCIEKYLENNIKKASNISEILCTRLKDITSGTKDLKFHATIPISANGQKFGMLNLLSRETQKLNKKQLAILNTISELMAIAIQRTNVQKSFAEEHTKHDQHIHEIIERVLYKRIDSLSQKLDNSKFFLENKNPTKALSQINQSLKELNNLKEQFSLILDETSEIKSSKEGVNFHYPSSPLTKRELEVLTLVKKGLSNKQIAENLFIAERTVKFHMSSVFSKLYASSRTEAVEIAVQRGLIGV